MQRLASKAAAAPLPLRLQPRRPARRQPARLRKEPLLVAKHSHNRLSPNGSSNGSRKQGDRARKWQADLEASSLHSLDTVQDSAAGSSLPAAAWRRRLADRLGQMQYKYYCWRQDTWSDLQLFLTLNCAVFMAGAVIEATLLRSTDSSLMQPPEGAGPLHTLWHSLYDVLSVVLGQELPPAQANFTSQLFAVLISLIGLASFALVLALVEQFVLEVLERNVQRGSMCYERGHSVVLAWCESSRDIAQLTRCLTQLCAANRSAGGGVVVVLTQQRGKLEMEQLFREVVPEHHRFGTRFVFRQGSPLDPGSLRLVAATDARRIIVCSDYSRTAMEADAQVLRVSVLLDELMTAECPDGEGGPVIVAQIKTDDALSLMQYACSSRIIPVPTNKVNARRYVRLLHNPIATVFSRNLMDFYSPAHAFIDRVPEVEGCTFYELHFRFPDALVVGLQNQATGYCQLNPPPDHRVQPGEDVILLRPGRLQGAGKYRALPAAVPVDLAGWDPNKYIMKSLDEQPLGAELADTYLATSARTPSVSPPASTSSSPRAAGKNGGLKGGAEEQDQDYRRGLYVLPIQYSHPMVAADELLICGWQGQTFMWELLAELDHSEQHLPVGSRVTLFNSHGWTLEHLEARCQQYGIRNLRAQHVKGDPRSRSEMKSLIDVSKFKAAIVVCDTTWAECETPDMDGGLQLMTQAEMLSLDAAMLMVQLNIRLLLEEACHPTISIICEKLTYLGGTRFEDDAQPPAGVAINSASYAAKALTKVAVEPRFLPAYLQLGVESDLTVQDASAFAREGEELSFLQLQARAASVRQVLMGSYTLPTSASQPLELVVNPQGLEERSKVRMWNSGDSRCKLVMLSVRRPPPQPPRSIENSGVSFAGSFASVSSGED